MHFPFHVGFCLRWEYTFQFDSEKPPVLIPPRFGSRISSCFSLHVRIWDQTESWPHKVCVCGVWCVVCGVHASVGVYLCLFSAIAFSESRNCVLE